MIYIFGFSVIILCFGLYIWHKLTYWRRQGLAQSIGHSFKYIFLPFQYADIELINKHGKIVGIYECLSPSLIVADPQIIHKILVKDFHKFPYHRSWAHENDPMGQSIFFLPYNKWKVTRAILSPTFTTLKLKNMIPHINDAIDVFLKNIDKFAANGEPFDMNYYVTKLILDILLRVLFATKIESSNSDIVISHLRTIIDVDFSVSQVIAGLIPTIAKTFGISLFNVESSEFIYNLSEKIIEERNGKSKKFNDLIQYLIDAESEEKGDDKRLSKKQIIDNCLFFFIAGYSTTASVLSHFIKTLAMETNIQENIVNEINNVIKGPINDFSMLNEMHYLLACINESMRLHSPVSRVERKTAYDVTIGNVTVPKDHNIAVPVYTVHRDPDNFHDPETYKPERFLPENKQNIKPGTFLPFGDGPRNCLGLRFAIMEIKLIMISLLKGYKIIECERTTELKYSKGFPILTLKNMYVKAEKRVN